MSAPLVRRDGIVTELFEAPVLVSMTEAPPFCDLDLDRFGAYRVVASCGRVWMLRHAVDLSYQSEALRGPVLLHALAHRKIFVLHASAVRLGAGPVIAEALGLLEGL